MRRISAIMAGLVTVAALAGCTTGDKAAQETPAYTVVRSQDKFEIRDYRPQLWAVHTERGTYRSAVEDGYIRLERYFTGKNSVPEAIPMKPPVMVRDDGGGSWTTMLPMPATYTLKDAPQPDDRRIRVVELPARRVAVVKFNGDLGEAVLREQAARLDAWLKAKGIAHKKDFTMARLDPPWEPAAWRNNEVLVTLE